MSIPKKDPAEDSELYARDFAAVAAVSLAMAVVVAVGVILRPDAGIGNGLAAAVFTFLVFVSYGGIFVAYLRAMEVFSRIPCDECDYVSFNYDGIKHHRVMNHRKKSY